MKENNKAWRCLICGYTHHGEFPPMECPICSAGPDAFKQVKLPDKDNNNTAQQVQNHFSSEKR